MDYQAVVERAKADVAAERLIRGTYWNGDKGCFVGCLRHTYDHSSGGPLNAPEWFWRLCDFGHENCPDEKVADNYIGIVEAVAAMKPDSPDDPRWQGIFHELMALMLERALTRADGISETGNQVRSAIQQVIAYHRNPNRTEEQRKVAVEAVWSAARSAVMPAAWSAARPAAWSASRAAEWSASRAAEWSAARSAVMSAEVQAILDDLMRLIREAK